MKKQYYSYTQFLEDSKILATKSKDFNADAILAIARGGMTLGHFMASILNNRNIFTINSISYNNENQLSNIEVFNIPDLQKYKTVLIVDDIVDTGKTVKEILEILQKKYPNIEFKIASIFYKTTACIRPDFFVNEASMWIDFFWEADI